LAAQQRIECGFESRVEETSAANDWTPSRPFWEARIAATNFLTCSFAEAAARSRTRQEALAQGRGRLSDRDFDWVRPPVLNPYTRLAVTMRPARGILSVVGYDKRGGDLPEPVTQLCEAARQAAVIRTASELS
jgi:hypothetical protein